MINFLDPKLNHRLKIHLDLLLLLLLPLLYLLLLGGDCRLGGDLTGDLDNDLDLDLDCDLDFDLDLDLDFLSWSFTFLAFCFALKNS